MATYIMFGKYSPGSIKEISGERNKKAMALAEKAGGQVKAVYALLGSPDIVVIAEFPGTNEAMKASVELTKLLEVSFTTAPALPIEEFDKLVAK